jgi:hypothetical protein
VLEIKDKAQQIVERYEQQLLENGIRVSVSKKYFETVVHEKSHHSGILVAVERKWLRNQEKKKGYHFQNNKYHCIVLTLRPVDQKLLHKEKCRQYAIVLQKVERAYIGKKPEKTLYEVNKVLNKIKKRIRRILEDAQDRSPREICADTWRDAARYLCGVKYSYKKSILGRDRNTLEMFSLIGFSVVVFIGVFLLWIISG